MKHTKGKWEVINIDNGFPTYVKVKTDQGDKLLCDVCGLEDGINNKDRLIEQIANARLIAAAPDLLEALKMSRWLLNVNTLLDAGNPASIKIDTAIAKAEGI